MEQQQAWRDFMGDTGGDVGVLPQCLDSDLRRTRDKNSSQGGEDNSTSSSTSEPLQLTY